MLVKRLVFIIVTKKGKELKVPYYANTVAIRNGNLPYIKATYLI